MRLSIEITEEQYEELETSAALEGQSIQEYVLKRVLSNGGGKTLDDLVDFLRPRVEAAKRGDICDQTVEEIFDEVIEEIEKQRGAD